MARGRPKLPEGERLVHVSLRLPKWVVDWYDKQGNRSARMRRALENELLRNNRDYGDMTEEDYEAIYGWGGQG